ncbi:MAG: hypothetical protein JKY65_22100 [Planctomycetes bacterium]|nr:hypothetical protein [Planctomycetota bacterium]
MGRRSDNPVTILIMGIILLAGFGVSLVLLTNDTPILKLKPLIGAEFGVDLRTRFRAASATRPAAVELILSSAEASPAPASQDEKLAVWALSRYLELVKETETGTTTVRQVEIHVEGQPAPRFVLTRLQFDRKNRAEEALSTLGPIVAAEGFRDVEVKVVGYSKTGAKISVTCRAGRKARQRRAAHKAIRKLNRLEFVGSIEFEVSGPKPFKLVGGRDTPLRPLLNPKKGRRPRRRGNRARVTSSVPAPVHSEGR